MLSHITSSIVPPLPSKGRQGNIMAHHHRESQSPELRSKFEKGDMSRKVESSCRRIINTCSPFERGVPQPHSRKHIE